MPSTPPWSTGRGGVLDQRPCRCADRLSSRRGVNRPGITRTHRPGPCCQPRSDLSSGCSLGSHAVRLMRGCSRRRGAPVRRGIGGVGVGNSAVLGPGCTGRARSAPPTPTRPRHPPNRHRIPITLHHPELQNDFARRPDSACCTSSAWSEASRASVSPSLLVARVQARMSSSVGVCLPFSIFGTLDACHDNDSTSLLPLSCACRRSSRSR